MMHVAQLKKCDLGIGGDKMELYLFGIVCDELENVAYANIPVATIFLSHMAALETNSCEEIW